MVYGLGFLVWFVVCVWCFVVNVFWFWFTTAFHGPAENPTEGMDDACSGLFLICSSNPSAYLRRVLKVDNHL